MFDCYIIVIVHGLHDHIGSWQYKLVLKYDQRELNGL